MKSLTSRPISELSTDELEQLADQVSRRNVERSVQVIQERSRVVREAIEADELRVVGALYDVRTGEIEFLSDSE